MWQKLFITVLGGILVLAGVVMLVLPGPGWLTIAAGVAVWAREYHWARRLLTRVKRRVQRLRARPGRAPKE